MKKISMIMGFLFFLLSTPAAAAGQPDYLKSPEPKMTDSGIEFVSGGASINSRQLMEQMSDAYSLKVMMTQKSGKYVSRCHVQIYDASGSKLVDTISQGPWLMVDLEPGRYYIKADYNGKAQGALTRISNSGYKPVILSWR